MLTAGISILFLLNFPGCYCGKSKKKSLEIKKGTIVILNGTSSAGKSSIARVLKDKYAYEYLELDEYVPNLMADLLELQVFQKSNKTIKIPRDDVRNEIEKYYTQENYFKDKFGLDIKDYIDFEAFEEESVAPAENKMIEDAKKFANQGKNVIIDTFFCEGMGDYNNCRMGLKDYNTKSILVYLPLKDLISRVAIRNKKAETEKKPWEKASILNCLEQFGETYKKQDKSDAIIVGDLFRENLKYVCELTKKEYDFGDKFDEFLKNQENLFGFVEEKVETVKITPKLSYDLIINSGEYDSEELAYKIDKFVTKRFPMPTGRYGVGTKIFNWIDEKRTEEIHGHPEDKRELMVQIWYPVADKAIKPNSFYAKEQIRFIQDEINDDLGNERSDNEITEKQYEESIAFIDKSFKAIRTYAMYDAKILKSKNKFPVLFFSHGYGTTRNNNTIMCEELASHGYVVIGIDYPYVAEIIEYPNGKTIRSEYSLGFSLLRANKETQEFDFAIKDIKFVLKKLEGLNSFGFFKNKLDFKKIGAFGHSFGGVVTTHICRIDDRFKAGVNMDGPLFGKDASKNFDKPFMFLIAGSLWNEYLRPLEDIADYNYLKEKFGEDDAKKVLDKYVKVYVQDIPKFLKNSKNKYMVTLKGTIHNTFSDLPTMMQCLGSDLGKISAYKSNDIINFYVRSFFDKYLLGKNVNLNPERYEKDVILKVY